MAIASYHPLQETFLNSMSLEKINLLLPKSEVFYISGATRIKIPDAPDLISLETLCNRVMDLSRNYTFWKAKEALTLVHIAKQVHQFHEIGYAEKLKELPKWRTYICTCSCDRIPKSVRETIDLGLALDRENQCAAP